MSSKSDTEHSHTVSTLPVTSQDINSDQYIPTSSLVYSLKQSVSNGKQAVASAITDKGVSTSATATFDTMANNIRNISATANWVEYTATSDRKIIAYKDESLNLARLVSTKSLVRYKSRTNELICSGLIAPTQNLYINVGVNTSGGGGSTTYAVSYAVIDLAGKLTYVLTPIGNIGFGVDVGFIGDIVYNYS